MPLDIMGPVATAVTAVTAVTVATAVSMTRPRATPLHRRYPRGTGTLLLLTTCTLTSTRRPGFLPCMKRLPTSIATQATVRRRPIHRSVAAPLPGTASPNPPTPRPGPRILIRIPMRVMTWVAILMRIGRRRRHSGIGSRGNPLCAPSCACSVVSSDASQQRRCPCPFLRPSRPPGQQQVVAGDYVARVVAANECCSLLALYGGKSGSSSGR